MIPVRVQERFHKNYRRGNGCWEWVASKVGGYGQLRCGRKMMKAHRISYILHKGEIPDGLLVRHTCHNPGCVNPDHLLTGTVQDNTDDKTMAGRQARGEKINTAKLTEQQVREIRESDKKYRELTVEYGISEATVWRVKKNVNWGHLKQETQEN